ncbi:MAG: molybdopterin dinucleotide binding domain-containing protein, partial [Gemmatimonadaceae bacterium]
GGAMFTEPAVEVLRGHGGLGSRLLGRWKSRVRGLPEFGGELPVAALAEEMDTPGEGQVHALVTHGGNPVLSTPNGARLDTALAKLDFFVAIDFYVNATTRHAHVMLPPTGPLERDHYDIVFHALATRNTAKYSPPMVRRPAHARHDWEIFSALTKRMSRGGIADKLKIAASLRLGARGLLDLGLRFGPYGSGVNPLKRGLSVARLRRTPHGEDLGALKPVFPNRLRTEDRTIHLAPQPMLDDVVRLIARSARTRSDAATSTPNDETLALIGRRDLRSNNSWMHNSERLVKGKNRCTLIMHPADAEARGIASGSHVRVRSRTGEVNVAADVSDDIMRGVVSLPHGWGHGKPGVRMAVASRHAGVSINDLTDELRLDELSGNAAFSGVAVTVELSSGATT